MGWPQEAFLSLRQILTPKSRPANGGNLLYVKADNELYLMNQDGTEHRVGDGVGSAGLTVQDENSTVATGVTQIDFQGGEVTATAGTGEVIVTIPTVSETLPVSIIDAKGDLIVGTADNTATRKAVGSNDQVLTADSSATGGVKWATPAAVDKTEALLIACSDETTAITTGTAKVTFRMPFALTLTEVRASLTTASSSGTPTVDINLGGTTVLSTKLTIDASELTSTTAATPPVISNSTLTDDGEITIDIDTAGTGAKGLKVYLKGTRP